MNYLPACPFVRHPPRHRVYVQFINFRVKMLLKIGDTMPTSFSSARPQRLGLSGSASLCFC